MKDLKKIPWLQNLVFGTVLKNLGLDFGDEDKKILYNMAIDETGYDVDMLNKKNIFKAFFDYGRGKNKDLADSLETGLLHLHRWSDKDLEKAGQKRKISKEDIFSMINTFDEKYDIFKDEANPVINKIINKNLLNLGNISDLWMSKYKDKYKAD